VVEKHRVQAFRRLNAGLFRRGLARADVPALADVLRDIKRSNDAASIDALAEHGEKIIATTVIDAVLVDRVLTLTNRQFSAAPPAVQEAARPALLKAGDAAAAARYEDALHALHESRRMLVASEDP
jgi:hypothetical protein